MFDLHKLGWHSFQQLSLTILREILGQTVESFLDTADGGRDGAFAGTWAYSEVENFSGKYIFQCKHTNRASYNLKLSDISEEIKKAKRLVAKKKCDCYILITNAGLSGSIEEKIEEALLKIGVKKVKIFGSTWINSQIQENKRLRMLVPRVYGLGDLSEILDERAYDQARVLLNSLREELAKVVITSTYHRAVEAINEHGFVLLIGEPAAGKTTIASLLSMAALDQWGAFTMKLNRASEVVEHWNPNDSRQFFWVDDAFGVTQYESPLTFEWNHISLKLKAMLRAGVKIVITSRDYIYNKARKDLKISAFPLLQESQVVIDVHDLTILERQQMLYNHLKLGNQSIAFKKEIKPYLEEISTYSQFVPEVARRLSDSTFTKKLLLYSQSLKEFVEKPQEFLCEVIEGLDSDSKAALGLIYMRNGSLESPLSLSNTESLAIERMGSSLGECITALEGMKNSLVILLQTDESYEWKFKHPTIGDAYGSILRDSSELLEIYIQGSSADELVDTITCGNVNIQRAVIVPKKFYTLVVKKLEQFKYSTRHKTESWSIWAAKRSLYYFLANRCAKDFLELYLRTHNSILDFLERPDLYLEYSPDVRLVIRLNKLGLFPEENRLKFIKTISDYTVEGSDFNIFENEDLQSVFTETEYKNLKRKVRERFMPTLSDWRFDRQAEYSSSSSAREHMEPHLDSLHLLRKIFSRDRYKKDIDEQIDLIEEWITETDEDRSEGISPRKKFETKNIHDNFIESRSIFDDIDQ